MSSSTLISILNHCLFCSHFKHHLQLLPKSSTFHPFLCSLYHTFSHDALCIIGLLYQIGNLMGAFLEQPITQKRIEKYQHKKLRAFTVQMQGWRKHMEDAILYDRLDKQVFVFGVFDGHGGAEVAQFCGNHMAMQIKDHPLYSAQDYGNCLREVFMKMDQMMDTEQGEAELKQLTKLSGMQPFSDGKVADSVGCTANVVLIVGNKLIVANTGDSRAALSRNGKIVQLSKDHKPEDPLQRQRIVNSGAKVEKGRINSHLNLSRSLGDLHYKRNKDLPANKQTVIAEPDIREIQLTKDDEFLVIGCDGVWQRYEQDGQGLIDLVREKRTSGKNPEIVLTEMLDGFLASDPKKQQLGCDNMSCVLIEFNKLTL